MDVLNINIPVEGSDEVVAVPIDQLPEDPEELLDILRAEAAPLILWLDFAKAYLARDKPQQFEQILNAGIGKDVEEFFGERAKYERVQILCGLAAYYTSKAKSLARSQQDRNVRQDHLLRANTYLVQARKIDSDEQLTYVGLGQLALARGDVGIAKREFETGMRKLNNGVRNISCLLCLAMIHFNQGQYNEALQLYCRALREHPDCPAEVRVGIAASYFKLGQFSKAKASYERVLTLNPNCAEAMLGLALLEFNSDTREGTTKGLNLLCDAYESSPHNPLVLNLLAHVCLIRGSYDKVKAVASAALANCDVDQVCGQSATYLARAHHATGNLTEAYRYYQQATKLDPKAPLPRFGLAQLLLRQREMTNAISLLEDVLADAPGWGDALQILGALYPYVPSKGAKAVKHFKEAAQKDAGNPQMWKILGELLAPSDPAGALSNFKKAVELYQNPSTVPSSQTNGTVQGLEDGAETGGKVPVKLLNNTAVLLMRAGETDKALDMMQQAVEGRADDVSADRDGGGVTMAYNLARIQEARGDLIQAEAGYKKILEDMPAYVDCLLRLACIARSRNDLKAAIDWADQAVKGAQGNPDALALLASLHMDRKDWSTAQEYFKQLIRHNNGGKYESYCNTALGNLNLYTTPADVKKPESRSKAESHLWHAMDMYKQALEKEPGNIYAANGLGAVVAECGHMEQAKEIFVQVQESAAASDGFIKVPDLWVNLAHVYLAQQNYVSSVRMYNNALKKFFHNHNADVLLYLARAHYDSDNLAEAKRALLRAVHLNPTDHKLRFNVALTMQEFAVRTLKKKRVGGDPTKRDDFERSVHELFQAHRLFTHLRRCGQNKTGIDDKKLKSHIEFCEATHNKAQDHLTKARKEFEVMETKRHQQLLILEADRKKREHEAELARAAERLAIEERERAARENQRKLEQLKSKWKEEGQMQMAADDGDGSKVGRKKGGGRKKQKGEDDFIDDTGLKADSEGEEQDSGEDAEKKQRGRHNEQEVLKAAGLDSSDDEEGELQGDQGDTTERHASGAEASGRLKRHRHDGGDGIEAEGMPPGLEDEDMADDVGEGGDREEQGTGRKRLRKAAVLDESDEEKEGGVGPAPSLEANDQDLFGDED